MTLDQITRFLFPYRTVLLEQLDYLRAQCAQKQRRCDELTEALIAISKPAPLAPRPLPQPVAPSRHGWKAYQTTLDQPAVERLNTTTPASLAQRLTIDEGNITGAPAPDSI
jgi:hypothetical protein